MRQISIFANISEKLAKIEQFWTLCTCIKFTEFQSTIPYCKKDWKTIVQVFLIYVYNHKRYEIKITHHFGDTSQDHKNYCEKIYG